MTQADMEQLPLDLKISLMLALDEFGSLWSLIRTCRSMNDAFHVSRKSILSSSMRKALDPDLLCDALALHHASSLSSRDFFKIKDFLCRWTPPCAYPPPNTPLFNSLARKQILIEWFQRELLAVQRTHFRWNRPAWARHIWPNELIRMHRAYYHFDLYATLFADHVYPDVDYEDQVDMDETREVFLDRLPPWEIEELASIHAYLHQRLADVGMDIPSRKGAEARQLRQSQHSLNSFSTREHLLSYGLDFLHSLFKTRAGKQDDHIKRMAGWAVDQRFLGNVLRLGYSVWNLVQDKPDFSSRMQLEDYRGPSSGWLWMHQSRESGTYGRASMTEIRNWGYCLWERKRMASSKMLDEPFDEKNYLSKLPWRKRKARDQKAKARESISIDSTSSDHESQETYLFDLER